MSACVDPCSMVFHLVCCTVLLRVDMCRRVLMCVDVCQCMLHGVAPCVLHCVGAC